VSTQKSNDTSDWAKETTNVLNGFPMKPHMGLHEAYTLMPNKVKFWACQLLNKKPFFNETSIIKRDL
jgi:hypothetical protein